jgi:hypothetical protein
MKLKANSASCWSCWSCWFCWFCWSCWSCWSCYTDMLRCTVRITLGLPLPLTSRVPVIWRKAQSQVKWWGCVQLLVCDTASCGQCDSNSCENIQCRKLNDFDWPMGTYHLRTVPHGERNFSALRCVLTCPNCFGLRSINAVQLNASATALLILMAKGVMFNWDAHRGLATKH